MKIWVDADACPADIKEIIIKAAHKRGIETIFVSNKVISIPESPFISTIKVAQGMDVADQYIAEKAQDKDLVITQDIPLAAILVPRGIVVISTYGVLFTLDNIGERLSVRNFMQELRDNGVQTNGPKPFSNKDKQKFANTFDQQLVKLL
ncbi:MAG TPA: YaiI/YqxD family protein [Candidatus Gastranaerophilales bacterium]|nr:YaiI/YqxD family protein [Candidatus Gastranaerophilales bacterium]